MFGGNSSLACNTSRQLCIAVLFHVAVKNIDCLPHMITVANSSLSWSLSSLCQKQVARPNSGYVMHCPDVSGNQLSFYRLIMKMAMAA